MVLPRTGESFGGCRIEGELARGGGGAVFAARGPSGEQCALKVLLGDPTRGDRRERFLREAKAGARLDHPGLVKVFGHGEERGHPYLVMEFVAGAEPLDVFVRSQGTSPIDRLRLLVQAAHAIGAAHSAGLIHRDLKPDNILVSPTGRVKVVDFGVARDLESDRLTKSGAVMGTLHYMAPEQVHGRTAQADSRTDIYSLGILLFQLLTDELPYDGPTAVEVMAKIVQDPPPDPRPLALNAVRAAFGTDLGGLAGVIAQATAKSPEDRYPNVQAFAADLEAVCAGRAPSASGADRPSPVWRGLGRAVGAVLVLGLLAGLVTTLSGPSEAQLSQEAAALREEAMQLLASREPLSDDAQAIDALGARWQRLDAARPAAAVEAQAARSLVGLLAFAHGDEHAARAALGDGSGPADAALKAALDALGDAPEAAALELTRALSRGIQRPEVRRWRALARSRSELTPGSAREVVDDLRAVEGALELSESERELRVRALLALGSTEEAQEELSQVKSKPPALVWAVALVSARRQLAHDPVTALAALPEGPPPGGEDSARRRMAREALRQVERLLHTTGKLSLTPRETDQVIALCRIARRVLPEVQLPEPLVRSMIEHAVSITRERNLPLRLALADLTRDTFFAQHAIAQEIGVTYGSTEKRELLPALRRAIALAPEPKTARSLRLLLCLQLSSLCDRFGQTPRPDEISECLEAASGLLPELEDSILRSRLLGARSRALRARGEHEASLADVEEAIRLNRDEVPFFRFRALTRLALGQREQALDDAVFYLRNTIEAVGTNDRMMELIWTLGREQGRFEPLGSALRSYVELRSAYGDWKIRYALVLLELGDPNAALEQLRRAQKLAERTSANLGGATLAVVRSLVEDVEEKGAGGASRLRQVVEALDLRRRRRAAARAKGTSTPR